MRALASQLLALEGAGGNGSEARAAAAVRVCHTLRAALTRLVGQDGFAALLRRALAVARQEVPALGSVQVQSSGELTGFEPLSATTPDHGSEAAAAIAAHLLALLVTFIGERLTLQVVREAWPNAPWDEIYGSETETQS
ncbi:MAG TPA: hypothetical protein VMP01_24620 [Pirellulaceae bacterium]|nr:hypothetical protein [Pirellulaceae bacterium]